MGNRNLPYMGQDTNVAMINYHANLKVTLRVAKSCDYLEDVWILAFMNYWGCIIALSISKFEKDRGVRLPKKKQSLFVVNVIFCVREIPNNLNTLQINNGGYVMVTSLTHEHGNYKIYNP